MEVCTLQTQEAFVKHPFLRRAAAVFASAALTVGTLMAFAGCSTDHPEVTITYTFNGKDYQVEYVLSRLDAPATVQHFIELADAGFYDGTCIHDYNDTGLYGGGYYLSDPDDGSHYDYSADMGLKSFELEEINYFETVQDLEDAGNAFTQSVWATAGTAEDPEKGDGIYTVYGEQRGKVDNQYGRDYTHSTGALVMYYTEKGSGQNVVISRADGGKNNDNRPLQYEDYVTNSATSLFYTYTGSSTSSDLERKYCVFGKAKDYDAQMKNGLLAAIKEYTSEQEDEDEEYDFTTTQDMPLNRYDRFASIRTEGRRAEFSTPVSMPIIIKSVRINKY